MVVNINGIEMYCELYGEGSPLVLLHGFTQSSQLWHPFVESFSQYYRLIVPDMRGHGRSTNPTNQFTHRQSAYDIFALLEELGIDQFKAVRPPNRSNNSPPMNVPVASAAIPPPSTRPIC